MKPTAFKIWLSIGVLTVLALTFVFFQPVRVNKSSSGSSQNIKRAHEESLEDKGDRARKIDIIQSAYSAPIEFYGKVVDQDGAPVSGARIHFSIIDKLFGAASEWSGSSDENGLFSVSGLKGAAVNVGTSKDGYYVVQNQSTGYFSYGGPDSQRVRRELPTKEKPAVFVLRKRGEAAPLIPRDWDVVLPLDGTPVQVDLAWGRKAEKGDLILASRANKTNPNPNTNEKFEWQFRMSIPGGGFLARTNEFDFIAPSDGYEPEIEVSIPRDDPKWRNSCGGDYFLKLGDGRYARMKLEFSPRGAHFASITSYLNPVPGDRNLEYDPQKKAKP